MSASDVDRSSQRVVIFADWDHWVPRSLLRALLVTLPAYPTLHVVAVCIPRPAAYWRRRLAYLHDRAMGWTKRLCLGDVRYLRREPAPDDLHALGRRHDFQVVVVPDANSTEAAGIVRDRLRAHVLLSIFWKRRFGAEFLALFEQAINYHNGSVPDYRGLRATPWSIYRGEAQSGFTFHRIAEHLDRGNVLVDGAVPIEPQASVLEVERAKTLLAESRWPDVLDAIAARSPGTPQRDVGKYNRIGDIKRLVQIGDPASVSAPELLRRVRAFGPVNVSVGEELVWVSGLGAAVVGPDRVAGPMLSLADGAWRVKAADWRAHRLRRIKRWLVSARPTAVRS